VTVFLKERKKERKKKRKKERKKKKGIAVVTRGGALDIVSSR